MLKNKIPTYKIIKEYHICGERVLDIWDTLESKSTHVADLSEKRFVKQEHLLLLDTGHVVNVRLYCPTTDKLLKLVLTY